MATENPYGSQGTAVFLKDKNGQTICPVTHENAIFVGDGSISLADNLDSIRASVPTKTSQLTNDSGFLTSSTAGAIITQVKSYTSGEFSVYDTNSGSGSFTAAGPGSGWYPTCVTVPHGSGTTTLGSGIYSHGITMTSAGNNTCSGTIYVSGNSGNASTNRGKCTYYVTWAKIS